MLLFFVGHAEPQRTASKYSNNGSIMSRSFNQTSTTECPHSLQRSYSLNQRHNWTHSAYPGVAYCAGGQCSYPQQTQHFYLNGAGGGAASCGYHHNHGSSYGLDQPGRLQKSYSFAFQTPYAWMNSDFAYRQPYGGAGGAGAATSSACSTIDRRQNRWVGDRLIWLLVTLFTDNP